jgi:hypothetical protein
MIKTKRLELVRIDNKFSNDLFEVWNDYEVIKIFASPSYNYNMTALNYFIIQLMKIQLVNIISIHWIIMILTIIPNY